MYFSLLKTNYLNSLHNINRKPFKKKNCNRLLKEGKKSIVCPQSGLTITVTQNKKEHMQIWQVCFHKIQHRTA